MIGAIPRARRYGARLIVLAGLISALAATAAGAENAHGAPGRVTEGALLYRMDGSEALVPAPVLNTDVHMVVTGIVARARVRQEFTNPGNSWTEGIYVFPLPEDAAVDHLRMRIGERVIEGVIKERAAAKAEYEGAKRAGQRASLVEQGGPTSSRRRSPISRPARRSPSRSSISTRSGTTAGDSACASRWSWGRATFPETR